MKLIIEVIDNKVTYHTDEPLNLNEFIDLTCTAQYGFMEQTKQAIAEQQLGLTAFDQGCESIFDAYNVAVSNVLNTFMPGHLRRDIGEEAILQMENALLMKHAKNI